MQRERALGSCGFSFYGFHRIRKPPYIHSTHWSLYSNEDEVMSFWVAATFNQKRHTGLETALMVGNPGSLQTVLITTGSLNSRMSSDLFVDIAHPTSTNTWVLQSVRRLFTPGTYVDLLRHCPPLSSNTKMAQKMIHIWIYIWKYEPPFCDS